MKVRFLKAGKSELKEAVSYYDEQQAELGDAFLDEIDAAIKAIQDFPKAHALITRDIRRIRTKRFPYSLVYKVYESEIIIVAVMHEKRKPGYWQDRV